MKNITKLSLGFFLLLLGNLSAQVLQLDPTFGNNGKIINIYDPLYCVAASVAVQPDGKIIAFNATNLSANGTQTIARYNADGSADTTFGNNGIVAAPVIDFLTIGRRFRLLDNGKILVTGVLPGGTPNVEKNDFGMAQYNPDGSPDTSFGVNGMVQTTVTSFDDYANSMDIQPDHKIVMLGASFAGTEVVRYNADGSLDTAFGNSGIVLIGNANPNNYNAGVTQICILSTGKMIVAGQLSAPGGQGYTAITLRRLNADGSIDAGYGTGGQVIFQLNDHEAIWGVAQTQDDRIVASGTGNYDYGVLLKFDSEGNPDSSFGAMGRINIPNPPGCGGDVIFDSYPQPDGKLISVGESCYNMSISRRNSDGTLDMQFDTDGIFTDPGTGGEGLAYALQPDAKILLAGGSSAGSAIIRLQDASLSNKGFAAQQQFTIYPNPFQNNITVDFNLSHQEMLSMQIIDLTGRSCALLQEEKAFAQGINSVTLNVPETFPKGVYFLTVHGSTTNQIFKISK